MSKHNAARPASPLLSTPRKSFESASRSSAGDHRRSSSEAVTPKLGGHTLAQAISTQELRRTSSGNYYGPSASTASEKLAPRSLSDNQPVPHKSLSKTGLNKFYDQLGGSRDRDMHRLGSTPAGNTAAAASASTLSLATSTLSSTLSSNSLSSIGSVENPWQTLHVFVLPLFNGEQLGKPIEDLNSLVRQHIKAVVSQGFSRAVNTIESDVKELVASGMLTLSAKLVGLDDEKLLPRTIEIWVHFFDQVLPYIEGVFLPVHTDALLLSLQKSKSNRSASPSLSDTVSRSNSTSHIDVRKLTLRSFRDSVILHINNRLYSLILSPKKFHFPDGTEHHQPRLQQMLLVLTSVADHGESLSGKLPKQSLGEQAVTQLLRAVRNPSGTPALPHDTHTDVTRFPSFMSGGKPRDRRGRIARKSLTIHNLKIDEEGDDGGETPRNKFGLFEREREREILASLRSPNIEGNRVSVGGWGLGIGQEVKAEEEDDDDETIEWDKSKVEASLVGLRAGEMAQDGRRKGTI